MKKIIHLLSKQLVRCILGYGRFIGASACGDMSSFVKRGQSFGTRVVLTRRTVTLYKTGPAHVLETYN